MLVVSASMGKSMAVLPYARERAIPLSRPVLMPDGLETSGVDHPAIGVIVQRETTGRAGLLFPLNRLPLAGSGGREKQLHV